MKRTSFILSLFMTLISCMSILSCIDLRDSDFKPDNEDSRLPAYSEKGYDIAGAIINNDAWRAKRKPFSEVMLVDISKTDTMVFEMYGEPIDGVGQGDYIDFYIYQTRVSINSFADLKKLEGKMISLSGDNNYAELKYSPKNEIPYYYKNGTGNLIFKSIREIENVTYNNTTSESLFHLHPVYISGTFELSFKDSLENQIKINKGRFDFKAYFKQKQ